MSFLVIKYPVMDDNLGVWTPTATTNRTIGAKVLMHQRELVASRVDIGYHLSVSAEGFIRRPKL